MTISSSVRTAGPYTGNAVATAFPFAFKVFQTSDVLVLQLDSGLAQTTLVLSVGYTVLLNADQNVAPGGTVTLVVPLPVGYMLSITSSIAATQPLSLPNQGGFYPRNIEDELDRLTILVQQGGVSGNQTLRVPEITGVTALSAVSARANNLLGFDSLGNPVAVAPVSGSVGALATDLANSALAAKGAGQIGFGYGLGYAVGTIGRWLQDLASATGSTFIGWSQGGTGSQIRNVSDRNKDWVSVFDFMTAAQITDVRANTAATNLAAALDVTAAITAAINYGTTLALVGVKVFFPAGSYKTTAVITTSGAGGVGQVGIIGAGKFCTRFFPSGDFTVFNIVTSYQDCGEFSIEWPLTVKASIPVTRIGVELASANSQISYATIRNIYVKYGYRGFVLNDWTGQPLGTMYLTKLFGLTAEKCADHGIWLNSKVGSTTLSMEECYVLANDSTGAASSSGIFINNYDDVSILAVAIDAAVDIWMRIQNVSNLVTNTIAYEGCQIKTAGAAAVNINSTASVLNGIKTISCTYNTSGNARILVFGANCQSVAISGFVEQVATIVGGTTRYKAVLSAASTFVNICDRSIAQLECLDNGFFANFAFDSFRRSSINLAPNYGTWNRGDCVKTGVPTVGNPKGWQCTVTGSPGTWVSEGNL